jgi:hypothetical protein
LGWGKKFTTPARIAIYRGFYHLVGRVYEIIDFRELYLVKPAPTGLWRMPQDINSLAL